MKISSMPPQGLKLDASDKARRTVESGKTEGTSGTGAATAASGVSGAASSDPVAQVALEVSSGKIGRKEAVDRILADVLGSKMVGAVPASARAELENTLRMLIDEDPYLKSLCAAMAPGEIE